MNSQSSHSAQPDRPSGPSPATPEKSKTFRLKICIEGQRDLCPPSSHDEEAYLIHKAHRPFPDPSQTTDGLHDWGTRVLEVKEP